MLPQAFIPIDTAGTRPPAVALLPPPLCARPQTAQEEVQQAIRQDTTTVLSKLKTVKTMLSVFVDNFYAEGREREDLLRAMREQLEKVQLGQQRADSRAVQAEKRAAAAEAKLRAQQEGFAKSMQVGIRIVRH